MIGVAVLMKILDLARWAPSGDNTQPWRFEVGAEDHVVVHGFDTRDHCVYDLDGHASQISLGALLETIAIAATRFGLSTEITRRGSAPDTRPEFDIRFYKDDGVVEDELAQYIELRSVQRRALSLRPLTDDEREVLQRAIGAEFRLRWFEGWRNRGRLARLNFHNAKLRLTLPEAYRVHCDVIQWNARTSEDRIPDAAVGASPLTLAVMRWAMASWNRVDFLNRYLAGTLLPRIELDLLPGFFCAAHCVILAPSPPVGLDDYVAAGRHLQRFWLTATKLHLQFQPSYTPLVFARYSREKVPFSAVPRSVRRAHWVRAELDKMLAPLTAQHAVFMGRVGAGAPAHARSTRLPLERLLLRVASAQKAATQST